jgi:hypothetical protein
MVGFAEGECAMAILELWLGTIIVGILALTALMLSLKFGKAAVKFGTAALVVDVLVAMVYVPWGAFFAAPGDDPDWHSLLCAWRTAARWWVIVSIATGVILRWLVVRHSTRLRKQTDAKPIQLPVYPV